MSGLSWFALHLLVLLLLMVWMAKRIVRDSRTLAIAVLCFWPLSIVALVRNWKQPTTDIRLPFFLAVLTAGLLVAKMLTTAPDPALAARTSAPDQNLDYTERQLEVIARDQPEFVARVREARRAAELEASAADEPQVFYEDLFDDQDDGGRAADRVYLVDGELSRTGYASTTPTIEQVWEGGSMPHLPSGAERPARSPAPRTEPAPGKEPETMMGRTPHTARADAAPSAPEVRWSTRGALTHRATRRRQDEAALRSAARKLSYQFGSVALVQAHAALQLPVGFRFVPGYSLPAMSRALGRPFDRDTTLGWVVHDSVDIAAEDAWYVEVEFLKTGLLRPSRRMDLLLPQLAGNALADGSRRRFGTDLLAPTWLQDAGVATWGVQIGSDTDPRAEILAAMPLRHGVLIFVMHDVAPERFELGLRTTRLLALQTQVEPLGQLGQFDPVRDRVASRDFLAWMRGESLDLAPDRG